MRIRCNAVRLSFLLLAVLLFSAPGVTGQVIDPRKGPPAPADNLPAGTKRYEGKYHILYTDITPDEAEEVLVRMTAMVDEYLDRTRDFSGKIHEKLPFLLFREGKDYYAAGGMAGSAGVFDGRRLMAIAGKKLGESTWHVVQHEGFHQFAAAVIGGDMPIWLNEGMAEYFGQAYFTGDGFQSGLMPDWRSKRIKSEINGGKFKTVRQMMALSHQQWNAEMDVTNYDQAWSMVQFLAHAENGKYQKAFAGFMIALNRGTQWPKAWQANFGSADGMEEKWKAYWLGLPDNPSLDLYARAITSSLTSLLARGVSQKQSYADFAELRKAIESKSVPAHKSNTLPASFNKDTLEIVDVLLERGVTFELVSDKKKQQTVNCTLKDGTILTGSFKLSGKRVSGVETKRIGETKE